MVWCGSMMMAAPLTRRADLELVAGIDIGLVPWPAGKNCVRRAGFGNFPRARLTAFSLNLAPPPTASTDTASTTICFAAVDEAEARLVRLLEGALHRGQGAGAHHQRRVGAGVADMRAHEDFDLGRRHALAGDFVFHVACRCALPMRLIAASALSPNGSSIACSRVARISASPMP